jgi:hypothetical protein
LDTTGHLKGKRKAAIKKVSGFGGKPLMYNLNRQLWVLGRIRVRRSCETWGNYDPSPIAALAILHFDFFKEKLEVVIFINFKQYLRFWNFVILVKIKVGNSPLICRKR